MDADPKAYASLFPIAERQAAKTLPFFQAEIDKKATIQRRARPIQSRSRTDWPSVRHGRRSPWSAWGKPSEVWPLLRHSADPRLRSFIVNWLNPLGADPKVIAAELERIDPNAKPTPAQRPADDGRHPVPSRDLDAAGVDPGTGDIRHGGAVPRRAGTADRQAARPLPQRPRRRHPRGGGMDPAAVEAAGEAQGTSMPS